MVVLCNAPCSLATLGFQITFEPFALGATRRDHGIERVYPYQVATQIQGVVDVGLFYIK